MTTNRRTRVYLTVSAAIACALLAAVAMPSAQPARADPPPRTLQPTPTSPRPTPTSTPAPAPPGPAGAWTELHVRFPETIPYQWQELWTVVQWQDAKGIWHNVEGWQGTLDHVATGEDGVVVGTKTWWVDKANLGTGPFRWQTYRSKGGWLLATSEEFDLPAHKGATVTVEVSLTP